MRNFAKICDFSTFPPCVHNLGKNSQETVTPIRGFGSGRENSIFQHFFGEYALFGENHENPLFLQKIQKIANVAPFRTGAEMPYNGNGFLMILEHFSLKSRILAKCSEIQ